MRIAVIALLTLTILCSCDVVKSEREIYGSYELSRQKATARMVVRPDHTYSEVVDADGQHLDVVGTWSWDPLCSRFEALALPKDFISAQVLSDKSAMKILRATPMRGIYRVDWCLGPEKYFGAINLSVDTDRGIHFVKINSH